MANAKVTLHLFVFIVFAVALNAEATVSSIL